MNAIAIGKVFNFCLIVFVIRPYTLAWRLGFVLQKEKGLIMPFAGLVKSFLGGKLGSGEQYFTWIHEEDFLNAGLWAIEGRRLQARIILPARSLLITMIL